jgi:hypothetical protein
MGSVLAKPELVEIYMKLGKEYGIPVFAPSMMLMGMPAEEGKMIKEEYVLVDRMFMLNDIGPDASWEEEYGKMIERVAPGLNVMIVHLAYDNAEMQDGCYQPTCIWCDLEREGSELCSEPDLPRSVKGK